MKIDTGASALFNTQRTAANTGKSADSSTSFASIMAEQLQAPAGSSVSGTTSESGEPRKYDFTRMSPDQLLKTVNGLIQSGDLTLDDTGSLLGMMGSSPLDKVNYDGLPMEGGDIPFNVFARIQDAIDGARSRNESNSVASLQQAAKALMAFQKSAVATQA